MWTTNGPNVCLRVVALFAGSAASTAVHHLRGYVPHSSDIGMAVSLGNGCEIQILVLDQFLCKEFSSPKIDEFEPVMLIQYEILSLNEGILTLISRCETPFRCR